MERQPVLHDVLADHAKNGDQWAMNELLREYQPLIGKFSWALLPGMESSTVEDMKQIASVAFIELVNGYSIDAAAFMTFVYRFLPLRMKRMADGEFQDRMVSPPVNVLSKDRTRIRNGEEPLYRLGAAASISNRTVRGADGPEEVTDADYLALLTDEHVVECDGERAATAKKVWEVIDTLPEADRKIMHLYYGEADMTLEAIAEVIGITRQALNIRMAKALVKTQRILELRNDNATHTTRPQDVRNVRSFRQASALSG